jgi:hypothetical protein
MPHLSWNEVRDRAIRFSREHAGDRSESAEKQTFWNDFFNVFGLRRASLASFEENVRNLKGNKGAIDLLWKGRLLVEHKSFGEDLALAQTQAFTYIEDLTREDRWEEIPRFVLVSDFARFVLYDLEPEDQRDLPLFDGRKIAPHHFTLAEFPHKIKAFAFMLGQTHVRTDPEDEANEKAYKRMCELHDALKTGALSGHDLERLLVRILFCLFAEDTLIFQPEAFTQFIRQQTREDGADLGARLNELFNWLNKSEADQPLEDTDPFCGFRYVNGGLFNERLDYPRFTRDMRKALLDCCDFQWAKISPAVFGSLFQGVMDDRARRQQGAHYTSERDIMKVLRSLFLDDLSAEWKRLKADRSSRRRANQNEFHQRLRSLQFLDPACGCGNFLVLAYRELRALEIEVVRELAAGAGGQQLLPIVNVDQFHGIEYSEWPVRIAEVALWLMDHQMNQEAGEVFGQPIDRLPLTTSPHIIQANALRKDWNEVLPRAQCSFVLGNPPFVGAKFQSDEQRADMDAVAGDVENHGLLDYVTGWYFKAADYIQGTRIVVGFVSTNSISQGEQVGTLWNHLFQHSRLKIHFAHRTFTWASEARGKAHVHVVIIGFAAFDSTNKRIYDYADSSVGVEVTRLKSPAGKKNETPHVVSYKETVTVTFAKNISPYLVEGTDLAITNRSKPICDVPEIDFGNQPIDGGHFILDAAQRVELLKAEPDAKKFLRLFLGSQEFINGEERWCLWLKDASPGELRDLPEVMKRVEAVRDFRLASKRPATRDLAATPTRFAFVSHPNKPYLLIPSVSSERRQFIPIGFMPKDVITSNLCLIIPDATHFHFGILSSEMHMAWVKQVCGRLESRYRYSNKLVYNNFPWPNPTPAQRERVDECARAVIAAREPHLPPRGMSTLADLYDPLSMPPELVRAHAALDRAVEKCYRPEPFHSDRQRVEYLFSLYEKLTAPLLPVTPKAKGRRSQTTATTPRPSKQKTPGLYSQKLPPGKSTAESEAAAAHHHLMDKEVAPPYRTPGLPDQTPPPV